jgi:riboflavin transporter FmnP
MLFGPHYGVAMSLIVALIEFVTISTTEVYGLLMNILSSVTFVLIGSVVYSYKKSLMGAVSGMGLSVVVTTAVMMGANLVITPLYMGVTSAEVAAMIPTFLLPFNLTKYIVNAAIVFVIYKPISNIIRRAGFSRTYENKDNVFVSFEEVADKKSRVSVTSIVVFVMAILVAVAAMAYFFICLQGSFVVK